MALQVGLSIFLAHGYDFRVEYVAGRNIVDGISPYLGGTLTGWMALGYGPQVQGIGETPLWALYLGVCYFLSAGQVFLFNFLSKIPIIAANVSLAYLAFSRGLKGWRFFLLNVFLIAITVTWGKPDNIATVLAILSLGRNRLREQFSTISFDLSHDKASCSGNPSRVLLAVELQTHSMGYKIRN